MLLNLARGELVEPEAVLQAVESGRLSRYVTDFPSEEFIGVKNVMAVPHLGASTPESEENCARMAARELHQYLQYGNLQNSVNLPDCAMSPSGVCRLCVLHGNMTNMVGRITAVLADAGCNIANMINKSRGEIAYTLLDLDHALSEEALSRIEAIPWVLRARYLEF